MAKETDYAEYVRSRFSSLDVVTIRPMMGAYVIHMAGKVLGFVDGDRLLLEPGPTIDRLLPDAEKVELFPGSKLFVVIPDEISAGMLCGIAEAVYDDLPISKPRHKKKQVTVAETPAFKGFPFEKHIK